MFFMFFFAPSPDDNADDAECFEEKIGVLKSVYAKEDNVPSPFCNALAFNQIGKLFRKYFQQQQKAGKRFKLLVFRNSRLLVNF